MNYDKIIVELLTRIQTLEEQMAMLMHEKEEQQEVLKVTMDDIREYIKGLKLDAKKAGSLLLVLTARDIHNEMGLKHRYPMVCNAMRDCMSEGDVILFQPPKGNSSTLQIEYKL